MRRLSNIFPLWMAAVLLSLSGCLGGQPLFRVSARASAETNSAALRQTAFPSAASPLSASGIPRTRILFTGDISLGRCVARRTLSASVYQGNYNYPFEYVAEALRQADVTVGSLDGSLSDAALPIPCSAEKNLLGPSRMTEGLLFAGFDVMSVATNHVKDCGQLGYECGDRAFFDTLDALRLAGIQPVGAGANLREARQPVIVRRNGARFAFLAVSEIESRIWAGENAAGTAPLSDEFIEQVKADIAAAKQSADVVIVMPHWGVEYAPQPVERQREWARQFIEAGASLVVGNHPHIIQPAETISGQPVFYALGNFVFDQEQNFRRESVVLEATFLGGKLESWRLRAADINYYTLQTHWVESDNAAKILSRAKMGNQ